MCFLDDYCHIVNGSQKISVKYISHNWNSTSLENSDSLFSVKGSSHLEKNGKKGDIVPFWRPSPPKRVKRGHLLSDYRQKCVNGTRDSYCGVKSPFLSERDEQHILIVKYTKAC